MVIPYVTRELNEHREQFYKFYNEIIIPSISENVPKKYYIIKTNQYMIDKSDILICYVHHGWGGAARTLEYAEKKNIQVVKL